MTEQKRKEIIRQIQELIKTLKMKHDWSDHDDDNLIMMRNFGKAITEDSLL